MNDINILWLKRDLRLSDHPALDAASKSDFLIIYIFEPSVSYNYDFDIRHWRFVYQSINEIENRGARVHKVYGEAVDVFSSIINLYENVSIFSHRETGNSLTFERDIKLKKLFKKNNIRWKEFTPYGVMRGLSDRARWDHFWIKYVKTKIQNSYSFCFLKFNTSLQADYNVPTDIQSMIKVIHPSQQLGGEKKSHESLDLFFFNKVDKYWGSLSYPEKSRYYTSRLSAHLAWGNITIRQIYQRCELERESLFAKKSLEQFMNRLKWHCHFIQKLESEPRLEFENIDSAFNGIRNKKNKVYIKAWKNGQTGFPLIDAAMRCVSETGFLNFRLRATVVSFLTHTLWQPWQSGSGHLARQFLDYEPGIHFAQFQMQAGTVGINTLRIYNPVKQSIEYDKEAVFIKRWVPELRKLPIKYIHEPWSITPMDELLYNFKAGTSYQAPIVDMETSHKYAREKLWSIKNSKESKQNSAQIVSRHGRKRSSIRRRK